MPRAGAGLALFLLAGCFWARPSELVERLKPSAGPLGNDTIVLTVAVLDLPVGDRYLNEGLWTAADEQVVALDRRAALEDNGFRVGVVDGIPPAEFLTLLTSHRSNPTPRQPVTRAGSPKVLPLGESRPLLGFQLHADGQVTRAEFAQAQCLLQVTPTLDSDGGVKLSFVPLVQHGSAAVWALPPDGGLPRQGQRPIQRYPAVAWDVTLSGTGYVVVGTHFDKAETLGYGCFINTDGSKPTQRLLAIRASRPVPAAAEGSDATRRSLKVTPLAQQAVTTIRGTPE
jgi:hypothetical protein